MIKQPQNKDEQIRIGRALREIRRSRGMSQTQWAEILRVSYQQVQKYEKGQDRFPSDRATELAEKLGISVDELLSSKEHDAPEGRILRKRRATE